jgi:hypothetical protein
MFCVPVLVFGDTEGIWSSFHVSRSRTRFRWYRGCWAPFSCFALSDSFSVVPWSSAPDFMFCASELVFDGTDGVGSRFHVFTPGHVFGGAEGVRSRFHVLRSRTHFQRFRGRRVPFLYFARPNSFSAIPTASAPGHVFDGAEGVGSRFYVLRYRTRFDSYDGMESRFHVLRPCTRSRRCRGHRLPFSCFAVSYSFSAVPWASTLVFMFYAPKLIFDGITGVGSRFHIWRVRTHFRRYRGRRVPFLCFARPNSYLAVPTTSGPVFMFCAPEHVFGGAEGVGSRFYVLRSRTRLRRFRGHRVPFLFFASLYSFSVVPWASGPIFMFCAPVLVFGGTEGVGSRFHVFRSQTHFRRLLARWVPFSCFAFV